MSQEPIIIERTYPVNAARVWNALTNNNEMKKWYFDLADFQPKVGFEFKFDGGPPGGIVYHHVCKITEVVPEQKICYSWRYEGYEGISIVCFELFEEGDKTGVKLTHSGVGTFPKNHPDFTAKNFVAGWTEILGQHLRKYLEG